MSFSIQLSRGCGVSGCGWSAKMVGQIPIKAEGPTWQAATENLITAYKVHVEKMEAEYQRDMAAKAKAA